MAPAIGIRAPRVTLAAALAWLAAGCDLTPDDRYVGLEGAPPFLVVATSVADGSTGVPLNQPLGVEFSRYLDTGSFEFFDALRLTSGGIAATGFTRYRLTDRTLTFFPTRELEPGLVYTFEVNPETVRSIAGESLLLPFSISFQTVADDLTVEQEDREIPTRSFEADVEPILAERCASCHRASEVLPPLSYATLFDLSTRTDPPRRLVQPYAPERSYLLHKVLPDYPDRRNTGMPPPWADEQPLDLDAIRLIEEWILTGARP